MVMDGSWERKAAVACRGLCSAQAWCGGRQVDRHAESPWVIAGAALVARTAVAVHVPVRPVQPFQPFSWGHFGLDTAAATMTAIGQEQPVEGNGSRRSTFDMSDDRPAKPVGHPLDGMVRHLSRGLKRGANKRRRNGGNRRQNRNGDWNDDSLPCLAALHLFGMNIYCKLHQLRGGVRR